MAVSNPETVQLREKSESLEKRSTAAEKASDWRRPFFAVALPIMWRSSFLSESRCSRKQADLKPSRLD